MDKQFICDVCSTVLPEVQLSSHIELHASQLARLCKKLRSPTLGLYEATSDIETDDDGSQCAITKEDSSTEHSVPSKSELFKCPDKTCDHKAFSRHQDLVRHYTRHYEINKKCSCKTFRFANKYVAHKHPGELDHKKAAKERYNEVRGDTKAALNQANHARKRRNDFSRVGLQKKQKLALSNGLFMDTQETAPCVQETVQSINHKATPFNTSADSYQSLAGFVNGTDESRSLFQSRGDMTAPATGDSFIIHSNQQCGSSMISEGKQPYGMATGRSHEIESQNQQGLSSEPPNLWDLANWPTDTTWNSGHPSF